MLQNLSTMAWSHATSRWVDIALFAALVRAAERCMCEFDTTRVANFMWGLARIKGKDTCVMESLGMAAAKCLKAQKLLDAKVDLQILAMLIWSLAQLQMLSKCVANTILKETRARIHEFSPCRLASTV